MYHIMFVILFLSSVYEGFSRKYVREINRFLFLALLFFVTFRYGQGSDYFNYIYLFSNSANTFETAFNANDLSYVTQEIGFAAISYFGMIVLGWSPETLSALFSAVSFILVWLFIRKYSLKPILSLFLFYCTFYLIYPFSGIRQGICLSIFIYYLIPLLKNKRYLKYYLYSTLLFTIHYSCIVLFIIPFINLIKTYRPIQVYILSLISLVIGLVLYQFVFSFFDTLDIISSKIDGYTQKDSFDIMSLLLRVAIFIPIMLNYKLYERDTTRDLFLKIYIMGFLLYLIFMSSSLISSRINVYMRYFEMILLVDFLMYVFKYKMNKIVSYIYIFTIMTVLYVKNISSFIDQGPYYNHVNFINYEYVSIFNKKKIVQNRYIPPFFRQYVVNE